MCSSNNYCGIALSSAINKVVDWLILIKNKETLITNDLQFAFKPHSSTSMCTLALKEVASYYNENGGQIFCAMLDASKAFDRLRYDKLFKILEDRNLDPLTFRLLLFSYENQATRTQWLDETSQYFNSLNGIRQGGVASPILFTVYMDELIHRLEKRNIGCYVGRQFFGVLCYADDVTLLAPTVNALQNLLDTCQHFGHEYDVSYNPGKSLCLQIGGLARQTRPSVTLNDSDIPWTDSAKYLGNIINSQNNDSTDIKYKRNDFIARTNSVIVTYRSASREARTKVFVSKCCSFYGSQAWRLDSRHVEDLHLCWRKAVRRLLNIPRNTRSALLPYLLSCKPFKHQLCVRFVKMLKSIQMSRNEKLKWLAHICVKSGIIHSNVKYIADTWSLPFEDIRLGHAKMTFQKDLSLMQRCGAVLDFLDNLNFDDVMPQILFYLCTF